MIPQARLEGIDEKAVRQLLGIAREGRTLDFKEALDLSDAGRRALAEDVCAFANTIGGDLVFGIREQGGVAEDIVPVELQNPDTALLQLTNALRDMVEPRVTTTLRSHVVRLAGGGHVIVLRVGLSPNAPHRVLRNNHFYLRNSVGKETMDIQAIRTAFAFADSLADRALAVRDRRLETLNAGGSPRPLKLAPLVAVHIVPLLALTRRSAHPVEALKACARHLTAATAARGNPLRTAEVNYEGVICPADRDAEDRVGGYAQLFRDGCIELVGCLTTHPLPGEGDRFTALYPSQYELPLVHEALPAILETFAALDVPPPAYLFLSLLHLPNALRIGFQLPLEYARFPPVPAHLSQIISAPVYVEDFGQQPLEMIRPVLDPVWNAVGEEHTQTQFR
ncbi:helix-turn-helix domain-containing protein [Paraburkholderia pallida]|uniref:ATP-binding protein n=1 Tax=Paraburkholderia pallida TaxID=2547399 RepID=A0A4P7D979_9BURK|nr:ATP-binding protein [Paraburkholderia pallida]QBR03770.1 ATP-binding protein [Paraburkholderia pallida]